MAFLATWIHAGSYPASFQTAPPSPLQLSSSQDTVPQVWSIAWSFCNPAAGPLAILILRELVSVNPGCKVPFAEPSYTPADQYSHPI